MNKWCALIILSTSFLSGCSAKTAWTNTAMISLITASAIGNIFTPNQKSTPKANPCDTFTALQEHQLSSCDIQQNFAIAFNQHSKQYAIVNQKGELLTPYYEYIQHIREHHFWVKHQNKVGIINHHHQIIVPIKYRQVDVNSLVKVGYFCGEHFDSNNHLSIQQKKYTCYDENGHLAP